MPTYVPEKVERAREYNDRYGPKVAYRLTIPGEDDPLEISKKPESAPPVAGEPIEGDIHPPAFEDGLKRLKAFPKEPGQIRTPAPPSAQAHGVDAREASIIRQHSQHMAVLFAATLQKEGITLPGEKASDKLESLRKIVDWFDSDVADIKRPL